MNPFADLQLTPFMQHEFLDVFTRLMLAIVAGSLIGLERTFHGRAAGFRTHALVCSASTLLMLLSVYQTKLFPSIPLEALRIDPTRMAQGIMTGIGFLGAGVIMQEKARVRGLTTAASIWMTASVGVLVGVGFYSAAFSAVALTLGVLSSFRLVENALPALQYGKLTVAFSGQDKLSENELLELIKRHDMHIGSISYQYENASNSLKYQLTVRTRETANFRALKETLCNTSSVREFNLQLVTY